MAYNVTPMKVRACHSRERRCWLPSVNQLHDLITMRKHYIYR